MAFSIAKPKHPGLFIRRDEQRNEHTRLAEYRRRLHLIEDCVRQGSPASCDPPAALYGKLPWNGEGDEEDIKDNWWRRQALAYHCFHRRYNRGRAVLLKILNASSGTLGVRINTNKHTTLKAIK